MTSVESNERLLERLLSEDECEWVEFKESWCDPEGVGRYISALGNGARLAGRSSGYLVWGVSNDREIVGTSVVIGAKRVGNQPFELWLKGRVGPDGHDLHFRELELGVRRVVILEIAAAEGVPVRFNGVPYVRVGQATPRLESHPDKERRLLETLVATPFDLDCAVEAVTDDEIFDLLEVEAGLGLLSTKPVPEDRDDQLQELQRFRLIQPVGEPYWSISITRPSSLPGDLLTSVIGSNDGLRGSSSTRGQSSLHRARADRDAGLRDRLRGTV